MWLVRCDAGRVRVTRPQPDVTVQLTMQRPEFVGDLGLVQPITLRRMRRPAPLFPDETAPS